MIYEVLVEYQAPNYGKAGKRFISTHFTRDHEKKARKFAAKMMKKHSSEDILSITFRKVYL